MKLLTYIFTFAYFLTTTSSFAASDEPSIAAIVNDKSILTSDLNHRLHLLLKGAEGQAQPEMVKKLRADILNQMIDEILQQQILKKFEIPVEGPELEGARATYEQRLGLQPGQLASYLKEQRIPQRIIEEQLKATIGWQKYISERYGKEANVTDAEVKAEMEKLNKQKQSKQALLSEIVVKYDSPEKADEARKKADEITAKIKSGAPFPIIAQQYSHSASAARGGDIGWVNIQDMEPEVRKVVESSRRGEITMPIAVSGGYRILGVRDRHGVGSLGDNIEYVTFQQVEFKFPMFGGQQAAQETYISAKGIREQARSCSMLGKLTKDRPRIKSQTAERIPMDNLHPELAKMLRQLKPGDRSDVMNTGDGLIMFMVCDKEVVKPHEPDEKEIRAKIRDRKLMTFYERELRSLRRAAMIEVRLGK